MKIEKKNFIAEILEIKHPHSITNCLNKPKRYKSAKGYTFKKIDEVDDNDILKDIVNK